MYLAALSCDVLLLACHWPYRLLHFLWYRFKSNVCTYPLACVWVQHIAQAAVAVIYALDQRHQLLCDDLHVALQGELW